MSTPNPPVGSPPAVGLANTPFYVRDRQDWAVHQEQYRHDQALYSLGESVMFLLMWKVEDYKHGYVRHCPRCYASTNDTISRNTAAYQQPTQNRCPMCYGTTFEGGIRAKIIRPALVTDTDDTEQISQRGVVYPQHIMVESTSDFRFRAGDYLLRADGSRWQLSAPTRVTVRTGYGHPTQANDSIGYATGAATLEDVTNVVWIIPPNTEELKGMLLPESRYPIARYDETYGPLIPNGWTD